MRATLKQRLTRWKRSLEQQLAELDGEVSGDPASTQSCDPGDALAVDADETLRAIVCGIARRYPGRPLVVYGSRAAGEADECSDLDVLVIEYDRNAATVQENMDVCDVEIDVTRVGFNLLLNGIKGRSKNNNNWFLNALRQCFIYNDRDGDARYLRRSAEEIWKNGPPALTKKQLKGSRTALLRLQDSAKKLCARARTSPEASRLARMRCDQLVAQSIYQFYCVRRKWTTSLHRLLGSCRSDYPELHSLWLEYVRLQEPEEAFDGAKLIVGAVHEGVFAAVEFADGGQKLRAAAMHSVGVRQGEPSWDLSVNEDRLPPADQRGG